MSQLRRTDRRDYASEPSLEDLRQSGQIEQDAHAVFLLHRPKGSQPAGVAGGEAKTYFTGEDKIIIAKMHLKQTRLPFPLQQFMGSPGVYVIMVEDDNWRPQRFRPIYFGEAWDAYSSVGPFHKNFLDWCAAAEGRKLIVSFMVRFGWSEEQRREVANELMRHYGTLLPVRQRELRLGLDFGERFGCPPGIRTPIC